MKNAIKLLALLAGVAFLAAGCYLSLDDGVGSVGIRLPEPSSSGTPATADAARIFVVNGSTQLELGDGTPYVEVALTGEANDVTVGPVPSGPGYQVVLAVGSYVVGFDLEEYFVPTHYDTSEEFSVYAGQATITEMTLAATPFVAPPEDFLGRDLIGVVTAGGGIYTASATKVFDVDTIGGGLGILFEADLPAGETAISIDRGAVYGTDDIVWLGTSDGIIPYSGLGPGGLDPTFETTEIQASVLDSGAYYLPPLDDKLLGFFQFDGGLGGVFNDSGTNEWLSEIDLSGIVVGQPVYDLFVDFDGGNVYGYFATKLGAFRLDESDISSGYTTPQQVFQGAEFFSVTIDGLPVPIVQLAANGLLYLGTPRGVVAVPKASIGGAPQAIVVTDFIPETRNRNTKEILIGPNYQVILTDNFIVVDTDGTPGVEDFVAVPLGASSVGAPTGVFLVDGIGQPDDGTLLIVGSGGLVAFDIDNL